MSVLLRTSHLHCLVYLVADKPTKDNISPDVPLVGTSSYKTLLGWLADMDVDITRVRTYNQSTDPFGNIMSKTSLNQAIKLRQIAVVALGQKATNYLERTGIISYHALPHPSGLNRILNNKKFIKDRLDACKKYIYEGINEDAQTYGTATANTTKSSYKESQDDLS